MGSLQDKLDYLNETKELIKQAIITKGVEVTTTDSLRSYVDKIINIPNGNVDITILDEILGSEEIDNQLRQRAINISNACDEIICQLNTSSVYEETELDSIDSFSLIVNNIIGE